MIFSLLERAGSDVVLEVSIILEGREIKGLDRGVEADIQDKMRVGTIRRDRPLQVGQFRVTAAFEIERYSVAVVEGDANRPFVVQHPADIALDAGFAEVAP